MASAVNDQVIPSNDAVSLVSFSIMMFQVQFRARGSVDVRVIIVFQIPYVIFFQFLLHSP